MLREELHGADLADADRALDAAVVLLEQPRSTWPVAPADPWRKLVLGLAFTILRVEGGLNASRERAVELLRCVVEDLRAGRLRFRDVWI